MFEEYRRRLLHGGRHMGEVLKNQSDMIMNQTFKNDIAYRKCYIDGKAIDAKYIVHTYYSISKDAVDYHLQFRPGIHYPIGKYVDVPDDTGTYNRWLIVGRSDEPQFVKYNILKCNWTFRWIVNGEIHECLGVLRSRNSYNSGLWRDYLMTSPENQDLFLIPTNPITQTISYNMRFLISDNQLNPIAWEVSKVEDTFPVGIIKVTLKQDLFDPNRDNKNLMIADYYKSSAIPKPALPKQDEYKISYSTDPIIKVGGSYKIFSVTPEPEDKIIKWQITGLEPDECATIFDPEKPNKIKIKAAKDYSLIGKTFHLDLYVDDEKVDSVEVEVIGL